MTSGKLIGMRAEQDLSGTRTELSTDRTHRLWSVAQIEIGSWPAKHCMTNGAPVGVLWSFEEAHRIVGKAKGDVHVAGR
jgi:hypothetical protein